MPEERQCPLCGGALPNQAPAGLCPACRLAGGLPAAPSPSKPAAPQATMDSSQATVTASLHPPPGGPEGTLKMPFSSEEQLGETIGRYKLLEKVGEGGFGAVYVAEQREPVRRRVALKLIKLGMDSKEVVGRFEIERQALAMMDHPNIAKVLDAGVSETGRPYFAMELVRGIRITDYCDQNKLPISERLKLFTQVCRAVQHAHQKGIIHRDIKPSNILVTSHDGTPVPKVIDFGIAKATQGNLTDKTVYTEMHQFMGTPAYMSPEQAEMSGLDIDTRTDIYSLGVLLYELLTGRTPFDSKQLVEAGFDEMRRIIREREPLRPSTQINTLPAKEQTTVANRQGTVPPKLIHTIRGDLDWIVMKALEKDRTRRYDTANGLAMDIERHINNEPVSARPPSASYRFQRLVRRNKLLFAASSAVMIALVAGIVVSTVALRRAIAAEQTKANLLEEAKTARQQADVARQQAVADARSAKEAATEARMTLAASDFLEATRLIDANEGTKAAAYLSRIIQLNPDNDMALTRLATLLTYHTWMIPAFSLKQGGPAYYAQFSPDGQRFATASDNSARVWDAQTGQPLTDPMKHDGPVVWAQFSPDGKRIVTASYDNSARVWDAQTGRPLTDPLKHRGPVVAVQFSPDGRRIVTASSDYTAQVWDAQSGHPIGQPLKHEHEVLCAQFDPDGQRVVTGSQDGTARVWDAQTGQPLTGPLKHTSPSVYYTNKIYAVQFSPDGRRVATASQDKTSRVWDAQTGQPLTDPMKHQSEVRSIQFSPDGQRLVTACTDNSARVWDAQTGQPLGEPMKHANWLTSARFSPDAKRVVTASSDGTARVWNSQTGHPLTESLEHGGLVTSAQFSPDGKRIITASQDTFVRVWDAQTAPPLSEIFKHASWVNSAKFSPDGKRIVTACGNNTVRLWDAQTGKPLSDSLPQGERAHSADSITAARVDSVDFSPDGQRIVTASEGMAARIWDAQTGGLLATTLPHGDLLTAVQFSPDGGRIVTASADRTARVWNAWSGKPITLPLKHEGWVNTAKFSPEGKRIVTASGDNTARVWDAQTGLPLTDPLKHDGSVVMVQFSPDGQRVVTASSDGTARVWDAGTGLPVTKPLNHESPVRSAQFSPDGQRIATASEDDTARIWDARTGQALTEPMKHQAWVLWAGFSPDGKRVATACGGVQVWDAQSGLPLTDPLKQGAWVFSARFSPDGLRIVTASYEPAARVWDVGFAPSRRPDWLLPLAEALSGMRLNERGILQRTGLDRAGTVAQIRENLQNQPSNGDGVAWGRWLLSDHTTRTISPFSDIKVPDYIENRIKEGTTNSLDEAEQLASGNPALLQRISEARKMLDMTHQTGLLSTNGNPARP